MADEQNVPKASPAKAAYHLKQLRKYFPRASHQQFLQMIWAVSMLRSGHPEAAATLLTFPSKAVDQSLGSRLAVQQWELETLLIQIFLNPNEEPKAGAKTTFDCSKFNSVAELVNRLRSLENVESAIYLGREEFNVLDEMHRIGQRQFHWQRGYFNLPQFYRSAFIYAQGKCAKYFEEAYGLSIAELNLVGFALYAQSLRAPWISRKFTVPEFGLTSDLLQRALRMLLITMDRAREETKSNTDAVTAKHGRPIPTAFLPSVLRRHPLVTLDDEGDFIVPIPQALLMRVTSGLYYDLISGGQALLNEANDRFEEYCAAYIEALMVRFKVDRAYRYEIKKGASVDTPDLLVREGAKMVLVAECKATKLTYLAQFAEDPFDAENKQYRQIVNGVFQLWRFFSHARRGLVNESVDVDTSAMMLTLDAFTVMNRALKARIIQEAHILAEAQGDIAPEDRRHIVFCSIQSLEETLSQCTEDTFLSTLRAARGEKYVGWELPQIHREEIAGKEQIEQRKFPFQLESLFPWWKQFNELRRAQDVDAPEEW